MDDVVFVVVSFIVLILQRRADGIHFFIDPEYKNEFSPSVSTASATGYNTATTV
jgi:hypothetical protein